jgi:RHH-type proline utilization regulon transcriptional repressor/proline dehydrogenase/delta 1-pyrroline-5-carboxylate dehydrogenase
MAQRITQTGFNIAAEYAVFRVHMLKFVAMLPSLDFDQDGAEVKRLLRETLRRTRSASSEA